MVIVWKYMGSMLIIRADLCCVVYDSCAQRYARKYEQLLNLSAVRVSLDFFVFLSRFSLYSCVFSVSLDQFGFVLSKLVLFGLDVQYGAKTMAGKNVSKRSILCRWDVKPYSVL